MPEYQQRQAFFKCDTHRSTNKLKEIILQNIPLSPGKFSFPDVGPSFAFEPIEIWQARFWKRRKLVDPVTQVRDTVVGVQIDKVSELAVDHPLDEAVAVFELDSKNGMSVV